MKVFRILAGLAVLVLFAGCVTGMNYTSTPVLDNMEYLGPVQIAVGPFAKQSIQDRLMQEARVLYGDKVDDVIAVSTITNVYYFFWRFKVEGKAVHYKE